MRKKHHIFSLPSLTFMKRMLSKGQDEKEQQEWAKHLQDDPFLSDAMEGLEMLKDSPTLNHRLNRIDRKTQQRLRQAGRRSGRDIFGGGKRTPFTSWQYMTAAAAAFAILLATVYMFQMLSLQEEGDALLAENEQVQEMEEVVPPFLDSTNVYRKAFELVLPPKGLFAFTEYAAESPNTDRPEGSSEEVDASQVIAMASRVDSEVEDEVNDVIPAPVDVYPYAVLMGEIGDESLEDSGPTEMRTFALSAPLEQEERDQVASPGRMMAREEADFSPKVRAKKAETSQILDEVVRRKGDRNYGNAYTEEQEIQYDRLMGALEAYKRNELVSALDELEIILKAKPDHVAANYYQGLILSDLGHSERAIFSFRRVLSLKEPAFYYEKTLWALANELDKLERIEEAIKFLDELAAQKGAFRKLARKFKREIISRSAEKE